MVIISQGYLGLQEKHVHTAIKYYSGMVTCSSATVNLSSYHQVPNKYHYYSGYIFHQEKSYCSKLANFSSENYSITLLFIAGATPYLLTIFISPEEKYLLHSKIV